MTVILLWQTTRLPFHSSCVIYSLGEKADLRFFSSQGWFDMNFMEMWGRWGAEMRFNRMKPACARSPLIWTFVLKWFNCLRLNPNVCACVFTCLSYFQYMLICLSAWTPIYCVVQHETSAVENKPHEIITHTHTHTHGRIRRSRTRGLKLSLVLSPA